MALPWPVSVAQRRAETGGCGVGQSNYKGMFQSIQPGLPSKVMQSIPKTSFCFQGINLFMRACLSISFLFSSPVWLAIETISGRIFKFSVADKDFGCLC